MKIYVLNADSPQSSWTRPDYTFIAIWNKQSIVHNFHFGPEKFAYQVEHPDGKISKLLK